MNTVLLGILSTLFVSAPDITATQRQRVHPVLIRNEHNETTNVRPPCLATAD